MTPFSNAVPNKKLLFKMIPLSNDSTLNSVFE